MMRLPWVSRTRYEAAEQRCADLTTRFGAMLDREQARYDTLLERYHTLRLRGAVTFEPAPPPAPAKEPDSAVQAINALSAGRPGLRAQMIRQLHSDRSNPLLNETDILRRIEDGVPAYEDGVPG